VYARSHGDDADAMMTGRSYVSGSVADRADGCIRARDVASPFEGPSVDIRTVLEAIAEALEVEEVHKAA